MFLLTELSTSITMLNTFHTDMSVYYFDISPINS